MQKKLIALAISGALLSAPALAQTSVEIYGTIDMGFTHRGDSYNKGTSSQNAINSGQLDGNRLGFKGVEDLGNGLKALFTLEAGFVADTGDHAVAGSLFNRQAFVGLTGDFGTAIAGRLYAPRYSFLTALDPFADGMLGKYSNVYTLEGFDKRLPSIYVVDQLLNDDYDLFNVNRVDNAVAYVSPTWLGGFNVTAAYSTNAIGGQEGTSDFHPRNSDGNDGDARVFAILPRYTNGPIDLGISYQLIKVKDTTLNTISTYSRDRKISPKATSWSVGGAYDFGVARVSAFYDHNKLDLDIPGDIDNVGDIKMKSWMLGVTVPYGKHTAMLSYNQNKAEFGGDSGTAKQWALGYTYAFSKRTKFYAAYADISNDDGDNDLVRTTDVGDGTVVDANGYQNGFQFGIFHSF
jgi:predicted porin